MYSTLFCDDISYHIHLEKCHTHFWIKVSQTLLDVLRHLISGETFQREICKNFQKKFQLFLWIPNIREICQMVHKWSNCSQIIHKFQKKYKYTCGLGVHDTYYVYSARAIHGRRRGRTRTNHGHTCVYSGRPGPGTLEHEHVVGTGSPSRATNWRSTMTVRFLI